MATNKMKLKLNVNEYFSNHKKLSLESKSNNDFVSQFVKNYISKLKGTVSDILMK